MARKLSPGIHERVKVGKHYRRVKVLASGKWKFLKSGTRSKSPQPKSKSRSRSTTSKGKGKGGGRKILGTIGWKGALASIASLSLLRVAVNRLTNGGVPGEYVDSGCMIGAGVVGKVTGIGTAHLLAPGIVLGASKVIEDIITPGGLYTAPGFGGGGGWDA